MNKLNPSEDVLVHLYEDFQETDEEVYLFAESSNVEILLHLFDFYHVSGITHIFTLIKIHEQ